VRELRCRTAVLLPDFCWIILPVVQPSVFTALNPPAGFSKFGGVKRWLITSGWRGYGSTRKGALLNSVPPGVTTCTVPVVAPVGTVVVIEYLDATVNVAAVP